MSNQDAIVTFKAQNMKVKAQLFLARRETRIKAEMEALIDEMTRLKDIWSFCVKTSKRKKLRKRS